jgi:hypothetical protein
MKKLCLCCMPNIFLLYFHLLSATLFMLKKYLKTDENITKKYLAYSIGIISSFWLIERVTFF